LVKYYNTLEQYVSIAGFATTDRNGGQSGNETGFSPSTLVFSSVSCHQHSILMKSFVTTIIWP